MATPVMALEPAGSHPTLPQLEWQDFMPPAPQAQLDATAILQEARRNPELTRKCFEHGWDGRRNLAAAREVVRKALPALESMRQRKINQAQASAADGADPDRTIPYQESINQVRKGRQVSTKLRTDQRRFLKEVGRLQADRNEMQRVLDECQRVLNGIDQELAKRRAAADKCDHDASALEADQATVKQALDTQTVALFREYAGIDLTGPGQSPEHPQQQPLDIDATMCHSGRPGAQRPVTRTAMRAELHTYGGFGDSPQMGRHVMQRMEAAATNRQEPYRPAPELDQIVDQARQRRGQLRRSQLEELAHRSAKEPRRAYLPDDWRIGLWEDLREVVRYHREEGDIPELWLEPDGERGAPLDSCWWDRFTEFWEGNARLPFDARDHEKGQAFRSQWRELTRDMHVTIDTLAQARLRDPGDTASGTGAGESSESDSDLERATARVEASTLVVSNLLQDLLDRGEFEGDEAACRVAREFLEAPHRVGDLQQISEILDRVQTADPPPATTETVVAAGTVVTAPPAPEPEPTPPVAAVPRPTPPSQPTPRKTPSAPRRRSPPSSSTKELVPTWKQELAEAGAKGEINQADSQALAKVADRFALLLAQNSRRRRANAGDGGRARRRQRNQRSQEMAEYTWASNRLGYVKNFLVDTHNVEYLRQHPERDDDEGDTEAHSADLDRRLAGYQRFHGLVDRMCKTLATGRMKPVTAPTRALELSSNYVHRDLWVADWPLCTLKQALADDGAGAERHNVAKPWNYTMGGWACIRCCRRLSVKDGNCRCRCFRGHTRTQCATAGSGCYGFHPNRFMEFIALGLPRDPVEYMEQFVTRFAPADPAGASGVGSSSDGGGESAWSKPAYTEAEVQQFVDKWMKNACDEMMEEGEPMTPGVISELRTDTAEYYRRITVRDLEEEAREARIRRCKLPQRSMEDRRWTSRQRWRYFRHIMKQIVKGSEDWFGVVPAEERGLDFTGIVDHLAPLMRDWFERLDAPRHPRGPGELLTRTPKTPAERCRWLAKFHLDLMLDETKYDPERRRMYPPNQSGPSWHWICDHCPLCGMAMAANKNNTCRGLCDGCRAWVPIVGPETRLTKLGGPYSVFRREAGGAGRKRRKPRRRKRARTQASPTPPDQAQRQPAAKRSRGSPPPPSPPPAAPTQGPSAPAVAFGGLGAALITMTWETPKGFPKRRRPTAPAKSGPGAPAAKSRSTKRVRRVPPRCGVALSMVLMGLIGGGGS